MAAAGEPLREFGPWSEQTSSAGQKYYYNCETEISQWDKPKEWKEHERRLQEAEQRLAEQQRMQQPIPPPPAFFSPTFPYPGPPPGFPGFPAGPFGNAFVPPAAVPPMPPPPRTTPTRHTDTPRKSSPRRRSHRTHASSPRRTPKRTSPSRPQGPTRSSSSNQRSYGRPSPSVPSGSQSRFSNGHDARTTPSQSESSRSHLRDDQKSTPHPYATPQPLNPNQPYRDQQTPKRVSQRDSRDGGSYEFDREKGKATKREYESGYNGEDRSVKRPAKDEEERIEPPPAPPQKQDENMDQENQEGNEEWRPYYRPELSKKKAAELGLEDDPELSDIQMQCLALENKWQNAEIQAKETAASRIILEHEVAMTNLRLELCRKKQRELEMKTAMPYVPPLDKRKQYLENLHRRLKSMKPDATKQRNA